MNSAATQPNLLELAKQGNANAIAALINRQLQPKGITVIKSAVKDGCLQLMLQADYVPEQQPLVAFIHKGMMNLRTESITKVKIYGQQTGDEFPAWSQEIELIAQINSLPPVVGSTVEPETNYNPLPQPHRTIPMREPLVVVQPEMEVPQITAVEPEIRCSKCKSTQVTATKKGFSLGKAVTGAVLTGGVGILGGFWGSNQIMLTCLQCGHRWKPGKK